MWKRLTSTIGQISPKSFLKLLYTVHSALSLSLSPSLPLSLPLSLYFSPSPSSSLMQKRFTCYTTYIFGISFHKLALKLFDIYWAASISRLLKSTVLFYKRDLQKRRYSAKEPYNFKEPTNRGHPIVHSASSCLFRISSRR